MPSELALDLPGGGPHNGAQLGAAGLSGAAGPDDGAMVGELGVAVVGRPPFVMPAIIEIMVKASTSTVWEDYREGSRFFTKEGDVYETLRNLVARLEGEKVDYAVVGAMALVAHGYRRFTEDVDILLSPEGARRFREKREGPGYLPAFEGASKTFRDTRTRIEIEILTSGEYPGDGKPKPVVFPDPIEARVDRDNLWVIGLEKLIELKLASGLTAPHRLKDLADVQELILHLHLPLALSEKLDASVRAEYTRLWQAAEAGRATEE